MGGLGIKMLYADGQFIKPKCVCKTQEDIEKADKHIKPNSKFEPHKQRIPERAAYNIA